MIWSIQIACSTILVCCMHIELIPLNGNTLRLIRGKLDGNKSTALTAGNGPFYFKVLL